MNSVKDELAPVKAGATWAQIWQTLHTVATLRYATLDHLKPLCSFKIATPGKLGQLTALGYLKQAGNVFTATSKALDTLAKAGYERKLYTPADGRGAAEAILGLSTNQDKTSQERPIPDLELHPIKDLKHCGLVKQKGVMAGATACKVKDDQGQDIGYLGIRDNKLLIPKSVKASEYALVPVEFLKLLATS